MGGSFLQVFLSKFLDLFLSLFESDRPRLFLLGGGLAHLSERFEFVLEMQAFVAISGIVGVDHLVAVFDC